MKVVSVADAQPVIHGEDDEPAARQILIERVGVGVIVRVVPSQQHLSWRTAVYVHNGGFTRARVTGSLEQMAVNGQPVVRAGQHLSRSGPARRGVRGDVIGTAGLGWRPRGSGR